MRRSADGNGLYLTVQPTGSRSWIQRIMIQGRRRDLGLGAFPLVSLREARELAFSNRKLAREGGDPANGKRSRVRVPTFSEAAERVWECRASADILETLRRIWHAKPSTAQRVRQRIKSVMAWAVAMEYRDDNPCDRLGLVLGSQQKVVEHMRAVPHREVAGAIRKMWGSGATPAVKLAFELLVLTAARSGEVRGARWDESDLAARMWTIPATRMKSKREHRVPLCGRAVEILKAARALGNGRSLLLFPSRGGKPISITRLPKMLSNLKVDAVPHGFRSSFRDWAAEETNHPREVVEAALAHAVGNQTEAAYARSDLFERRRRLMAEWAAYLGDERPQLISLLQ